MATSEVMFSLKCDLCHSDGDIEWKCEDCDEWFCYNCKTAHTNSKVSKGHNVVSFNNRSDVTEKQQIKRNFCSDHPDEPYNVYCTDCQRPLCLRCIIGRHKSHDFVKLSDTVERTKKEFPAFLDKLKSNQLADLERSVNQLQQDHTDYNKQIDRCQNDIKKQGKQFKDVIDKLISAAISDLQRRARDDRKFMKEMKAEYTQQLSELRKIIKTSEEKLKSGADEELIKLFSDVKNALQRYESTKAHIRVTPPSFVCNKPDEKVLKHQFGFSDFEMEDERASECESVTMVPISGPHTHLQAKIISKFQHPYSSLIQITCRNKNEAWIAGDNKLSLVRKGGKVVKFIDCGYSIFSLGATTKGKILFPLGAIEQGKNPAIKTLNDTENGITDFWISPCSSLFIFGIYITADDDIYASHHSKVLKISSKGTIKQTIDFEDGKYEGLTYVNHITQNVNGDIWVSSSESESVVALTQNGEFRFQYKVPSYVRMEKRFSPAQLISNKNGQVLIADAENNKIHLVDRDGNFLQFLLTEEHGLDGPYGIAQDKDGRIWVGCPVSKTVVVAEYLK